MSKITEKILSGMAIALGIIGVWVTAVSIMAIIEGPEPEQYQAIKDLPQFVASDIDQNNPSKEEAVIALFRMHGKGSHAKLEFHCTAFVISDKLAVTAAHCLVNEEDYNMTKDDITIKNADLKDTKVIAHAAAINVRADMGVITGDFSNFNKMKMREDGLLGSGGPFLTCGFPWGAKPMCSVFQPESNFYTEVQGKGNIYPGMSGGPVVDLSCGMVVGINTEAIDGHVVVAPTNGIFGALEITTKSP
jgi:hypothetical protein